MSIQLTDSDSDGKLENYSYDFCDNLSNDDVKSARGLVYKNNFPFIKAFGYTPVFTQNTIHPSLIDEINNKFDKLKFYYSLEGTLIRLFYNDINDKWYMSTHKKLDASNSKWGTNITFGQLFKSCIPENFYDSLEKDKFYLFILTPNKDNRIVCNQILSQIFHVGTYDFGFNFSYDYNIGIQKPPEIKANNFNEILQTLNDPLFPYTRYQGIIISNSDTQTNIKLYNNLYDNFQKIRGNTPSIKFRYLEVRTQSDVATALKEMFVDYVKDFDDYEEKIDKYANILFIEYMKRYISKQYKTLLPNEHYIIKKAHEWHKKDKDNNKISKEKMKEMIDSEPAVFVNSLIKNTKKN
tara:strand:+ start:140 stop:1195 length:1056 start_codon:yes stop_codon:yes gene_type:complete